MAWRRPGDKPLSEPILVRSLTHICVTRPHWHPYHCHSWSANRTARLPVLCSSLSEMTTCVSGQDYLVINCLMDGVFSSSWLLALFGGSRAAIISHDVATFRILYPTLAREFQGFRVWGNFVFRTLELTDTPTNLASQVKVGHALDQSRSIQSRGPERAHQNNEPSWRSSRRDRRLSRQFWDD